MSATGFANAEYATAWAVAFGGGLLAFAFWCLMTRGVRRGSLRWLLRLLPGAWMLVPAPVPGYEGQYAPAFIVALFEAVLQENGAPQTAFAVLAVASVVVLAGVAIVSLVRWRARRGDESETGSEGARAA